MNKYAKDLGERVFWTFVQGMAAVVTADQFDLTNGNGWKLAAAGSLPAVYAVIKGGIAKFVGDHSTAAMLSKQGSNV